AETPGHAAERRPSPGAICTRRHQPRHARLPGHRRALQRITATRREEFGRDYFANTTGNRFRSRSAIMITLCNVRISGHLVALDFAPEVTAIVSQPFWLCWRTPAGKTARHAPDF